MASRLSFVVVSTSREQPARLPASTNAASSGVPTPLCVSEAANATSSHSAPRAIGACIKIPTRWPPRHATNPGNTIVSIHFRRELIVGLEKCSVRISRCHARSLSVIGRMSIGYAMHRILGSFC